MKLCYAKITIELVKKLIGYEHPQPHFLSGPYEHLPHSNTPKNVKKWKEQSERVLKCDHLGQSTTVTFILLAHLEGTALFPQLQAYTEFDTVTLFY